MATTDEDSQATGQSVLRRKTEARRAQRQARAMTLTKALRQTLAKVADDVLDMALAAIALRTEERSGDMLEDVFDDISLMMLLDGPNRRRGAVMFDPILVGALIQQQTMGQVRPDPGGDPRPMTETDAAISAPFLDALLERAAGLPEDEDDRQWLSGYRFGARAEDRRLLLLALDDANYKLVHLTVDVAGGIRQGQIVICLPMLEPQDELGAASEDEAANEGTIASRAGTLSENVMALTVDLHICIARKRVTLRDLSALKPGNTLELGSASFDAVQVMTADGRRLAEGALGQKNGLRALRITPAAPKHMHPKRRASDRADLGIPDLAPLSTAGPEPTTSLDLPTGPDPHLPDLADLPDMSDLPELNIPGFDENDPDAEIDPAELDLPPLDLPELKTGTG